MSFIACNIIQSKVIHNGLKRISILLTILEWAIENGCPYGQKTYEISAPRTFGPNIAKSMLTVTNERYVEFWHLVERNGCLLNKDNS